MSAFKGITPSSSLIAVTGATILFEPETLAKGQDIMKWLPLEETEEVKMMHTQEIMREYGVTTGAPVPRQAETKPIPIVTQDSDDDESDHEQLSLTNRKKMEDIDCNELEDIARRCAVNDFTETGRLVALAWTSLKRKKVKLKKLASPSMYSHRLLIILDVNDVLNNRYNLPHFRPNSIKIGLN
jgi:hypothetical protein